MINWESDNEGFYTVVSDAINLVQLENELTETIIKIMELKLFSKEFLEFYSDATNGSFFIHELDDNKERTADSKTVHFCALKLWEDYDDSNEFDSDMKRILHNSIETIKIKNKLFPFNIILRDELGDEEEIFVKEE